MSEQRAVHAQRLAFWGSDEDLQSYFDDQGPEAGTRRGPADVETALAAFGLKEE